jgi:hypothetical protein
MRDRRYALILAALWLLQLGGCASDGIDTSTTFDPLTVFPAAASYVWDDRASSLPQDPRIQQLDLSPLIREVANQEFASRGYRDAGSGDSNYRLSYQLTVNTWIGADNSRSVASLSLMLVENASNRRVWVGFTRAEIHVGLSRDERRERLRRAVSRMLAKFPPSQRGS